MTDTALILRENLEELDLFVEQGSDLTILAKVTELSNPDTVYDMECLKGRKACASMAYRIARTKTLLDAYGKDLVAPRKAELAAIDARRKYLKDNLTELQKKVRAPLDAYEAKEKAEAEKKRVAMNERLRRLAEANFTFIVPVVPVEHIPAELARVANCVVTTEVYGEQVSYAQGLKDKAIRELTEALAAPVVPPEQEPPVTSTADEHQVQAEARKGVLRSAGEIDPSANFDEALDAIQKHCGCSRVKARNLFKAINEGTVPFLKVVV